MKKIVQWLKQLWRSRRQAREMLSAASPARVGSAAMMDRGLSSRGKKTAIRGTWPASPERVLTTGCAGEASALVESWPGWVVAGPAMDGQETQVSLAQRELVGVGSTHPRRQAIAQQPTVRLAQASSVAVFARRYLIDTDYLLPKDLIEANRLDFQHFYLKHVLKSNYLAPLNKEQVHTILDVGCGTGRWVIEMARAFPQARVYGIDLEWSTPPQKLPPNVAFLQGDVLEGLPFSDHTFDYVHQRLLALGIPAKKWPFLLQELQRVTAPGGWIELFEGGDTFVNAGPALRLFIEWYRQACKRAGYDPAIMDRLGNLFQSLGLRNVRLETLSVPVGPWGRHEGVMLQKNLMATFPGLFPLLQQQLNIDERQFNIVLREINREMEIMQVEYQYYVVYGQK